MPDEAKAAAAAQSMINRYGEEAFREVELRINELRNLGQYDAGKFWLAVRKSLLARDFRRRGLH